MKADAGERLDCRCAFAFALLCIAIFCGGVRIEWCASAFIIVPAIFMGIVLWCKLSASREPLMRRVVDVLLALPAAAIYLARALSIHIEVERCKMVGGFSKELRAIAKEQEIPVEYESLWLRDWMSAMERLQIVLLAVALAIVMYLVSQRYDSRPVENEV